MKLGILTTGIANELSYDFRMFTLKIAPVIQENLSVTFLNVLSILKN